MGVARGSGLGRCLVRIEISGMSLDSSVPHVCNDRWSGSEPNPEG